MPFSKSEQLPYYERIRHCTPRSLEYMLIHRMIKEHFVTTQQSGYVVNLVYSYSHRDSQHRASMERSLALLKADGLLMGWSDQSILSGNSISAAIRRNMDNADIIVFLLSPDFIASEECMKEWRRAEQLAAENPQLFRVPIIIRDCAWKDLLAKDDLKALPQDGVPIVTFGDQDIAWQQVYEGIKAVVNELRSTFTAKPTFLAEMERTDFISQQSINLRDLFVFLPLICRGSRQNEPDRPVDKITEPEELLRKKYALIHGADRSGKTALGRYMLLTLAEQSKPALYVDLNQVPQNAGNDFFRKTYHSQFHGDYSLWVQQADKTLIMDNLSGRSGLIDFVVAAKEFFDKIIITLPSTVFYAFFRDESRLAAFEELEIADLTQTQQEILIRKRLSLTSGHPGLTDAYVDRIEDRVNSIIMSNRIVPRYPFFVLCILQTYEAYMPAGLAITSYGHCYYVLIVASLVRAGISRQDSDINTCFNFAEHLAFEMYQRTTQNEAAPLDLNDFIEQYRSEYIIPDAFINRLKHEEFGLIDPNGQFRMGYMHHFFLGRFLSKGGSTNYEIIQRMCETTYVPANYLTLLFTIHHTSDLGIIDDILLRTMCTLDDVQAAKLDSAETRRFQDIVSSLPRSILSAESVESERKRERQARDDAAVRAGDAEEFDVDDGPEIQESVNGIYRVLKNNEIMGQILRNKYGSITKRKIEEIIYTMADGGLRLVNFVLKDEDEIADMAHYVKAKNPEFDIQAIKRELGWFSFVWTIINVEHIVRSINVPEVSASIQDVAERTGTPAYGVIAYFTLLDTARELTMKERTELARLLKKHPDPFINGVLSIRTQLYMNTHRSKANVEQSICSLLGIKYLQRPIRGSR